MKGKSCEGPSLGTQLGGNAKGGGGLESAALGEIGDIEGGQVGSKEGLLLSWCEALNREWWPAKHPTWHSNPAYTKDTMRFI